MSVNAHLSELSLAGDQSIMYHASHPKSGGVDFSLPVTQVKASALEIGRIDLLFMWTIFLQLHV